MWFRTLGYGLEQTLPLYFPLSWMSQVWKKLTEPIHAPNVTTSPKLHFLQQAGHPDGSRVTHLVTQGMLGDPCFWQHLLPGVEVTLGKEVVWEGVVLGLKGGGWSLEAQQATAALLLTLLRCGGKDERQVTVHEVRGGALDHTEVGRLITPNDAYAQAAGDVLDTVTCEKKILCVEKGLVKHEIS